MTVETTLPHGLQTSTLGSAYKAEYDANLNQLDANRITVVVATAAALPAAGTSGRFAFAQDTGLVYYDNGTTWSSSGNLGTAGTAGTMLINLSADQALPAAAGSYDILFNTIAYRTGALANATLDATGGIIIPTGVARIRYAARISLGGMSSVSPSSFQLASNVNHNGTPSEGANQMFYIPGNAGGIASCMVSAPTTIDVVAGDVIDTRVTPLVAPFPASVLALTANLTAARSWMYIEAV